MRIFYLFIPKFLFVWRNLNKYIIIICPWKMSNYAVNSQEVWSYLSSKMVSNLNYSFYPYVRERHNKTTPRTLSYHEQKWEKVSLLHIPIPLTLAHHMFLQSRELTMYNIENLVGISNSVLSYWCYLLIFEVFWCAIRLLKLTDQLRVNHYQPYVQC